MGVKRRRQSQVRLRRSMWLLCAACVVFLRVTAAQGLTGALIGTVKDAQGGVLPGAVVRVTSPALIGGPATVTTNEKGQLRFPRLPPGAVRARRRAAGIRAVSRGGHPHRRGRHHRANGGPEAGGRRGIDRGRGSRLADRSAKQRIRDPLRRRRPPRDPHPAVQHVRFHQGCARRFAHLAVERHGHHRVRVRLRRQREPVSHRRHELHLPVQRRRSRRAGVDFIQEIQIQSVGASAEFGNIQGAVFNVVTRQGSNRFLFDASYYGQPSGLTSQPVALPVPGAGTADERIRARAGTVISRPTSAAPSFATDCGSSPAISICATTTASPAPIRGFPRTYEQNKVFAKLTWRLAPGLAAGSEHSRRALGQPGRSRRS